MNFICCNITRPENQCRHPPCWFQGHDCDAILLDEAASISSAKSSRSLNSEKTYDSYDAFGASRDEGVVFPDMDTWFDTAAAVAPDEFSAFANFHGGPESFKGADARRMQDNDHWSEDIPGVSADDNWKSTPEAIIWRIELIEQEELHKSRRMVSVSEAEAANNLRLDAMTELEIALMPPFDAMRYRQELIENRTAEVNQALQDRRELSQRMTRGNIVRDRFVKTIISRLKSNQKFKTVDIDQYRMWIGRTTNLSAVQTGRSSSFQFPQKFAVPRDTPILPTDTNPLSSFAFQYVELKKNLTNKIFGCCEMRNFRNFLVYN